MNDKQKLLKLCRIWNSQHEEKFHINLINNYEDFSILFGSRIRGVYKGIFGRFTILRDNRTVYIGDRVDDFIYIISTALIRKNTDLIHLLMIEKIFTINTEQVCFNN